MITMKEVKTGKVEKWQLYERNWNNNKKNQCGKWIQIQRRIFKAMRTKLH
jgi:hypothetical protein